MEPIELSVDDQVTLFCHAAANMGSDTRLWNEGADLCLRYDIEKKNSVTERGSKLCAYLNQTIDSDTNRIYGMEIRPLIKYMDMAIDKKIFIPRTKTYLLGKILKSDAILYKEELNKILSFEDVRRDIRDEFNNADPRRQESDEGLKRAYERLRKYEHDQILLDGRGVNDIKLKKEIKATLGGKMAEAIFEGIAPHKGITEGVNADILKTARKMAQDTAKKDKLADRQEKLEQEGFVRKVINRKRQQIK